MKVESFQFVDGGTKAIEEFVNRHDIVVSSKHVVPGDQSNYPFFVFFYESLEEQGAAEATRLRDDQENLKALCKIAGDFVGDNIYAGLKNQGQRQMYMTSKGIGKQDALDIIELLKPEMQAVLEWGRSS